VRADVQERKVWIVARGDARRPRDLLAVIRREFEEIHDGIAGLAAEEKVPLPTLPNIRLDYKSLLVREANGKRVVEVESDTKVIELSLGKLLDNIEEPAARQEQIQLIHLEKGAQLIMGPENWHDFSGANIINSVVGSHLQSVTNAIQEISATKTELRASLEELNERARALLPSLTPELQNETAQNLEDFVKEAAKDKPRKPFLEVTAKGLIGAASTVAALTGPVIQTIEKLKPLLGF
jgi:hypothetical protein